MYCVSDLLKTSPVKRPNLDSIIAAIRGFNESYSQCI